MWSCETVEVKVDPQLFANLKRCRCSATQSGAHAPGCPAFRPSDPQEDRGTHYRVWYGGEQGLDCFNPFLGAAGYDVVSVPIGWSPQPSRGPYGVVMRSVSGRELTGRDVRVMGMGRLAGFRTVDRVLYRDQERGQKWASNATPSGSDGSGSPGT
jgi:hypothetical protein